jgi:hypothetical protein
VKKWLIPVIVVVVIAVAAGAFFGGRATAGSGTPTLEQATARLANATPQERQQMFQNAGRNGTGGPGFFGGNGARGNGGGAVTGTIVSADNSSITVKSQDGSTKIVLVPGSTTIAKNQPGTMGDLTAGQTVIVTGTSNSDGTVTATRVQVGVTLPSVQGAAGQGATQGQGTAPTTPGATTAPGQ